MNASEDSGYITILDLASWRLKRPALNGQDFMDAGLEIMGGCQCCGATLAAYNGHPTKTGYWQCTNCVNATEMGWKEVQEANMDIFGEE